MSLSLSIFIDLLIRKTCDLIVEFTPTEADKNLLYFWKISWYKTGKPFIKDFLDLLVSLNRSFNFTCVCSVVRLFVLFLFRSFVPSFIHSYCLSFVPLFICSSIPAFVYLCTCACICPSVHPSGHPFVYLSV